MLVSAPLKGVILKEPAASQNPVSLMISEGKVKGQLIVIEDQSPLSSPDHPSYRVDDNDGTSTLSSTDNLDLPISTGPHSSDSLTKSSPPSMPTSLATQEDPQPNDPDSANQIVIQTDLHKLVEVVLKETTIIPFEGQGKSIFNPSVSDNNKLDRIHNLDDFCCLMTSSSSLDESTQSLASSSDSSSDQKISDISFDITSTRSSPLYLYSTFADDHTDNETISSASMDLLDVSACVPFVIRTVNLLIQFVQENLVTSAANSPSQITYSQLALVNSQSVHLQNDLSTIFYAAKKGETQPKEKVTDTEIASTKTMNKKKTRSEENKW